jgi:hypothetical protein
LKSKHLLPLLASIILVLILVATSCTLGTTASPTVTKTVTVTPTSTQTTAAAAKDKTYRALNPEGNFVPVETKALAPRLDTIEGKTIYVWQGESDPVIGPALYPLLQKTYPKTNWVYVGVSGTGLSAPEEEVLKNAKGVIRLNGW